MPPADALIDSAGAFADELADLLQRTVIEDPPIRAEISQDRVVVAASEGCACDAIKDDPAGAPDDLRSAIDAAVRAQGAA